MPLRGKIAGEILAGKLGKNRSIGKKRGKEIEEAAVSKLIKMNTEEIEAELESEFGDVGIDIEGNLIILEKRKLCVFRIEGVLSS